MNRRALFFNVADLILKHERLLHHPPHHRLPHPGCTRQAVATFNPNREQEQDEGRYFLHWAQFAGDYGLGCIETMENLILVTKKFTLSILIFVCCTSVSRSQNYQSYESKFYDGSAGILNEIPSIDRFLSCGEDLIEYVLSINTFDSMDVTGKRTFQ